jgi:hypothetical protein
MAKNNEAGRFFGDLVTAVRTSAQGPLYDIGTRRVEGNKVYRYVKYESGAGGVAAVAGNVAFHVDGTYDVTSDVSDSHRNLVAVVLSAVIADEGYGWGQVFGPCTVNTSGGDDILKGDAIISANTDGTVDDYALSGNAEDVLKPIGFALADDNDGANTVSVFLQLE